MNIGDFKHWMAIEKETAGASDGQGGFADPTWTTHDNVWAKLKPFNPRSEFYAQGKMSGTLYWLTIRYRADVTSANRFVLGSRVFIPQSPPKDVNEESTFLEFVVRETTL